MNQLLNIQPGAQADAAHSVLLMEAGMQHVFFGIMSMGNNEIQQASYYSCNQQEEDVILYQVFEKHPELKASFYQVIIGFQFAQNILIPEKFYQVDSTHTLLEVLHGQSNDHKVISEKVEGFDFYNVYQAPQYIYNWMNRHYSHAKYLHGYTAGIRNIHFPPDETPQLIVDFKPSQITVYALKHNQLQLVQMFPYESPSDVVYYLARICFQLGIPQQEVKIIIEGLIDESSAAYANLQKYFTHVQFGQLPDQVRFAENFNEHPVHFFILVQIGCMRIISGSLGGRKVKPPAKMPHTRPTTDIAKEALFNILQNNIDFEDLKTLDLFGGTGSISYELASRGAKELTVVEKDEKMYNFIKSTATEFKLPDFNVVKMDVFRFIEQCEEKFDFIFAGPPYALTTIDNLPVKIFEKNLLNKDGWFILEHTPRNNYKDHPHFHDERTYGTTVFSIFI